MSKPVNLNKFKKAKKKAEDKTRADRNSVVYGLTKDEKQRTRSENARQSKIIDLTKRER
jgi:hypothetical protein